MDLCLTPPRSGARAKAPSLYNPQRTAKAVLFHGGAEIFEDRQSRLEFFVKALFAQSDGF
jgi:hypothetical protein